MLSGFRAQSFEEIFGKQRNGREANASCIFHGVDDCRCGSVHGQLSDTFGAMRAVNVAQFFKKYANRGQVHRSRHDVIRHLIVAHPAVLPDNFFIEGETDGLRDSPHDLSFGKHWMQNFPNFLECHEVIDRHAVGCQINRNFCNVNGPRECRVRFAAIFFIVPKNIGRGLISRIGFERPMRRDVFLAGGAKFFRSVFVTEQLGSRERFLDSLGGRLDQFSDNHRRT